MGAPLTLSADFFEKKKATAPDTLPADFFTNKPIGVVTGDARPQPGMKPAPQAPKPVIGGQSALTTGLLSPERIEMLLGGTGTDDAELGAQIRAAIAEGKNPIATGVAEFIRGVSRDVKGGLSFATSPAGIGLMIPGPTQAAAGAVVASEGANQLAEGIGETIDEPSRALQPDTAGKLLGGAATVAGGAAAVRAGLPATAQGVRTVGKAVGNVMRETVPEAAMREVLGPHLADFKFGRQPVKAVVAEGIAAVGDKGMLEKITARKKEYGKKIEMQLSLKGAAQKQVNVADAIKPVFDEARRLAAQDGNTSLVTRLDEMQKGYSKNPILKPAEAAKLKREIGEMTTWSLEPLEASLNSVRQKAYRAINDAIDVQVPGTKDLNARYADLLTAEKAMGRKVHQGRIGVKDIVRKSAILGTSATALGPAGATALLLDTTAAKSGAAKLLGRRKVVDVRPIP